MKKVLVFLSLCAVGISTQALASPLEVVIFGAGGENVCVVQNESVFSRRHFIARGLTQLEAESAATNGCLASASFASDCGVAQCVRDENNIERVQARVDINIGKGQIDLSVVGMRLGAQCMSRNTSAFDKMTYLAKAGTELEAKAMAIDSCLSQASFASDCAFVRCEAINLVSNTPVTPGIQIPGIGGIELPKIELPKIKFPRR